MGIHHILPLGMSPGVVTSPLAYIKHQYDRQNTEFFGRDSNRDAVKKTSGIVIFTTRDIYEGKLLDNNYVDNPIDSRQGKPIGKHTTKVIDVVKKYIRTEYGKMLEEERASVYWLEASSNDFDFNLMQLIKAFHVLSPVDSVGREIWVNLTGGTNIVNIALSTATALSGVTGRQYYTYVETDDVKFLRPLNVGGAFWCELPVLKLNFDLAYEVILRVLLEVEGAIEADLLSLVLQDRAMRNVLDPFTDEVQKFRKNYLNKLDGWLIKRDATNLLTLSDNGHKFLKLIDEPLVKSFLYKTPLNIPLSKETVLREIEL